MRPSVFLVAVVAVLASAAAVVAQDQPAPLFSQLTAPPDERTPQGLVARLYERTSVPTSRRDLGRFFTGDLAAALLADGRGGEVGAIDGDYRYDAQDVQRGNLTLDLVAGGADTATVEARFRNFGEAKTVRYRLCRLGPNEWRIADVAMPSGELRALLGLPPAGQASCA
ncbi:MAG TPA: hypothetical protein VF559_02405 [Caulobacteraceae bacterium]|jgi:hypothetical protein